MGTRKHSFAPTEFYHCFNRGVEKREIFCDEEDLHYFIKSVTAYNTEEVLGKLRLQEVHKPKNPPISILAFCLLPNHFHILLENNLEDGASKYFQRLLGGYTMYFNKKYKRTGSLFQGTFKSKHIPDDQALRQVFAYVKFNYKVHSLGDQSLFSSFTDETLTIVRGLTSNYGEVSQHKFIEIVKDLRTELEN